MALPQVIVGMLVALVVCATGTYLLSGSAWVSAGVTLVAAVVLQAGYFLLTTVLVAREYRARRSPAGAQPERRPDDGAQVNSPRVDVSDAQ